MKTPKNWAYALLTATALSCAPEPPPFPIHSPQPPSPEATPSLSYEQQLRTAHEIEISESSLSFGKHYNLNVGGKKVGEITGKGLTWGFGDVFTLTTLDGRVLASEEEQKRFLSFNRAAVVHDGQGKATGYIAENTWRDLFSWGYVFHFYDGNQQELGRSEKIGKSALNSHKLLGTNGHVEYNIDKHFVLTPGDHYTLKVITPESKIPLE